MKIKIKSIDVLMQLSLAFMLFLALQHLLRDHQNYWNSRLVLKY